MTTGLPVSFDLPSTSESRSQNHKPESTAGIVRILEKGRERLGMGMGMGEGRFIVGAGASSVFHNSCILR